MRDHRTPWARCLFLCGLLVTAAGLAAVERPFILWNAADAVAIRERVAEHEWARRELAQVRAADGWGQTFRNLFLATVFDDAAARERERRILLSFIGAEVDERRWSDQYLTALRYDCLYDTLTPEQRTALADTMRRHVDHQIHEDHKHYTKTNWLPNMQWPRAFGAHLLAVALADTERIEAIAKANGGWCYYFDSYVSDGWFYNEEFAKQYSMIGEMLLWCRGLERLGLDHLGYGYVGRDNHGATMRRYLGSFFHLMLPRLATGDARPPFPRLSMGDARGGAPVQHAVVHGTHHRRGRGDERFRGSNMNGRDHRDRVVEKLMDPMWYEIAHARWPEDGYDFLLAQMREPDEDRYHPSLFWGIEPIEPATVTVPPAPSAAWRERGFALLRADETPGHWTGTAPVVGLRFATRYAHGVPDCFALLNLHAHGRPLLLNRQVSGGYAGRDPSWSNSIKGHCGLWIDDAEPATVGEVAHRFSAHPLVKFVAPRGAGIYPDAELERALFLTDGYLVDCFRVASPRVRDIHWAIHGLGHATPDEPHRWTSSSRLFGTIPDLAEERSQITDGRAWAVTWVQPIPPGLTAPPRGLRTTVLGAPNTVAHLGLGPMRPGTWDRLHHGAEVRGEPSIVAARTAARTVFAALHEPFRGSHRIAHFRRLAETPAGLALAVQGSGIDDRVLLAWGDGDAETTLAGAGESFTFHSHAFLRVGAERITVVGEVPAFALAPADGRDRAVWHAGEAIPHRFVDGRIVVGSPAAAPRVAADTTPPATLPGTLAARFWPRSCRLGTGGAGATELVLRNGSLRPLSGSVALAVPEGFTVRPTRIELTELAPGAERRIPLGIEADAGAWPTATVLRLATTACDGIPIAPAELHLSRGVTRAHEQVRPKAFAWWIRAPRYSVRYDYLDSAAAALVLDASGRRHGRGTLPRVLRRAGTDAEGERRKKQRPREVPVPGYRNFRPNRRRHPGAPPCLEDAGQHPHGARSDFEYRFTEDWIWLRYKHGGPVSLHWEARGRRRSRIELPAAAIIAGDGEAVPAAALDTYSGAVSAAWCGDAAGLGRATFYPPDARLERGRSTAVWFEGGQPMAFTFCKLAEFDELARRWRERGEDPPVARWGQGDVRE